MRPPPGSRTPRTRMSSAGVLLAADRTSVGGLPVSRDVGWKKKKNRLSTQLTCPNRTHAWFKGGGVSLINPVFACMKICVTSTSTYKSRMGSVWVACMISATTSPYESCMGICPYQIRKYIDGLFHNHCKIALNRLLTHWAIFADMVWF